jgi:hypothetical protein
MNMFSDDKPFNLIDGATGEAINLFREVDHQCKMPPMSHCRWMRAVSPGRNCTSCIP